MDPLNLVKVKALVAFTEPTPRGMFHGDPNNSEEAVQFPSVPDYMVDRLVDEGKVETEFDPLDHDRNGRKGGPKPANPPVEAGAFTLVDKRGGYFEISGPGLDQPEKVRGKAKAEARLAELEAEHAAMAEAQASEAEAPAD